MKRRRIILNTSLQLVIGLLIGAFVLSHSTSYTIGNEDGDQREQADNQNDQQQITLSDAVQSPPNQNALDHHFFLLEELLIISNDENDDTQFNISSPLEKALKVLFRQIKSPNAP